MKRKKPDEPLQVVAHFETVADDQMAADLFATMLRCVELESQLQKEEAGREACAQRSRTSPRKHQ